MFFSVALVAGNLWLIIGILLRLVRIKVKVHWEDKVFVFITMILRLVLIPYVIMSIFFIAIPYAKQIELFEQPIALIKQANSESKEEIELLNETIATNNEDSKSINISFFNQPLRIPVDENGKIKWLDKLIAGFIFHFETYPKSACKKAPEQRSLPIDENLLLLVSADDSDLGYRFSVGPCVGNFSDVERQVEVDSSPE
jgi:hypothetical protein